MDIFEYVSVLTSIIIGLGITHLLRGLVRLIQQRGTEPVYVTHLLWVAYMLFSIIMWWWWEFGLSAVTTWTLGLYLFVSAFALVFFLLCSLLFPPTLESYAGYRDYFMRQRRWFFGLLALGNLLDLGDTLLKGTDYFASLGIGYVIQVGLAVTLCMIAILTRNARFHVGFAALALTSELYQAVAYSWTVG
jgi:hypothetical protein